jgi:hypothetical protein
VVALRHTAAVPRFSSILLTAALTAAAFAAPAGAQQPLAVGTYGATTLDVPVAGTTACGNCYVTPYAISLGEQGLTVTETGMITTWSVVAGGPGSVALSVLHPVPGQPGVYTISNTSPSESVAAGTSAQTFSTSQPVLAGDTLAVFATGGAGVGFQALPLNGIASYVPPAAGSSLPAFSVTPLMSDALLLFNATVTPAPIPQGITPTTGPMTGGTTVTITGQGFNTVSGVTFGGVAAQSFTVTSPTTMTAVTPPGTPGNASLVLQSSFGVAGPSLTDFSYTGQCTVPNLKGKTVRQAQPLVVAGKCILGTIRGGNSGSAVVVSQSPKAGSTQAVGTRINLVLAKKPRT